jgi:transposase
MMPENKMIVGIDVSKRQLDVHIHPLGHHFSVANTPSGWAQLAEGLAGDRVRVVALEASGGYERAVAGDLTARGYRVRVLNPAQVRHFARAAGRRGDCQDNCVSLGRDSYCLGNLSAKMMANWFIAAFHSLSGIFHFFSALRNAR